MKPTRRKTRFKIELENDINYIAWLLMSDHVYIQYYSVAAIKFIYDMFDDICESWKHQIGKTTFKQASKAHFRLILIKSYYDKAKNIYLFIIKMWYIKFTQGSCLCGHNKPFWYNITLSIPYSNEPHRCFTLSKKISEFVNWLPIRINVDSYLYLK